LPPFLFEVDHPLLAGIIEAVARELGDRADTRRHVDEHRDDCILKNYERRGQEQELSFLDEI
jgi:hypothetical protein